MLEFLGIQFTWNLMKMRTVILLAALFVTATFVNGAHASRVGDFALLDHTGTFHQLSYYGDQAAVVMVVHANDSAAVNDYLAELELLQADYAEVPVVFHMLNAVAGDTRQSIAAAAEEHDIALPILVDETQLVAESLGVKRVGEVLVIKPDTMQLVYRGSLDQLGEVRCAINATVKGTEVTVAEFAGAGEPIAYAPRTQTVSYSKDIAPILEENCVQCHHEGGIGPWAMTGHAMVQGWSAMMREVVMTQRMPPGQVDPHVGRELLEVAGLTTAEMQKLVHWIDAGAPGDDAPDPLEGLQFANSKWGFGEPDLVYTIPAQEIPATGVLDYRYVPVELNLDRDVWVKAMEFIPGDPAVVHHVIAYVSSPADKTVRGRATGAAQAAVRVHDRSAARARVMRSATTAAA